MTSTIPIQRGMDHWFFHLIRWELRFMRGRRRVAWWIGLSLLGGGVAFGIWHAATQPESLPGFTDSIRTLALALLGATPPRDQVAELAQMTLGYDLLRFAAYTTVAFCKVALPALAAGTIAGDRTTGRLQDLQMLPIRPGIVYLAKLAAAALPFMALSLLLFLLFAGVAFREYVPFSETMRLVQETFGQIVLSACIVVTCSACCKTPWSARTISYLLLWGLLPGGWLQILMQTSAVPSLKLGSFWMTNNKESAFEAPLEFSRLCLLQAGLTYGITLLAWGLGVVMLRRRRL